MAAWGNALGGFRRQRRDARGRFAGGKSVSRKKVSRKKVSRKTTVSRSNGTTYRTTHKRGLFGGTTVSTTAYRGREYRGSVEGFHRNGKATVDFLYVSPSQRGNGVSKALVSRQVYHARRHGLVVHAPSDRSDGGQKFIDRNSMAGAKIGKRSSMSSGEVTDVMNSIGASNARSHEKQYDKALKKKAAHSKKMSTKKKVAIGAGVAVGVGVVGAAVYNQRAYNRVYNEMHALGGEYSYTDIGKGISVTNIRTVSRGRVNKSREALHRAAKAKESGHKVRATLHYATSKRVSIRPQLHDMGFVAQNDKAVGFYTTEIRGNRMHAKDMYLDSASRGNKTIISQMSRHTKTIQGDQVSKGRKIVISKFRSEDSERVVRNQAKRLGKENVIVQKRYRADQSFVDNITKNMDEHWKGGLQSTVDSKLIPGIKEGYKGEAYRTQRQRARDDARATRKRARDIRRDTIRRARSAAGVII